MPRALGEGGAGDKKGLMETGLTEAGSSQESRAPAPPSSAGRIEATYHAGMDRSLLNVPCNACDKCIPVLEVCVKVSL